MKFIDLVAPRRLGALALGAAVTLSWGERAAACRCRLYDQEQLTLELESVTVDGAPTADVAAWQRNDVTLHPDPNGEVLTLRWHERDGGAGEGSERYDPIR